VSCPIGPSCASCARNWARGRVITGFHGFSIDHYGPTGISVPPWSFVRGSPGNLRRAATWRGPLVRSGRHPVARSASVHQADTAGIRARRARCGRAGRAIAPDWRSAAPQSSSVLWPKYSGSGGTPTIARPAREVARLPGAMLWNEVQVVEYFGEAAPRVARVVEEVRADDMAPDAPSRFAARAASACARAPTAISSMLLTPRTRRDESPAPSRRGTRGCDGRSCSGGRHDRARAIRELHAERA
jgi:hypothetical protein